MKYLISFLLIFLSFASSGQTSTLTCFRSETIDKRLACNPCLNQDELFSGVTITTNGVKKKIYAPFKVKIYSDRYFELLDAYGNNSRLDITRVSSYNTKSSLLAFLKGCTIDSIGSSGGSVLDTNYVHKDSNEYIRGTKIFQPTGAQNWIIVDSTLTFLGLDAPSILHIEKDHITIDRLTTPSGGNQVLVRDEIIPLISSASLDTAESYIFTGVEKFANDSGDSLLLKGVLEYHNKTDNPSAYFGLKESDGFYAKNSSSGSEAYIKPGRAEIIRGSYIPNGTTDAYTGSETQSLVSDTADVLRTLISTKVTEAQAKSIVSDTSDILRGLISTKITEAQAKTIVSDSAGVLRTSISGKQSTLVSGTNIKTVNGSSLLGSGDLTISSATSPFSSYSSMICTGGNTATSNGITYTNLGTGNTKTIDPSIALRRFKRVNHGATASTTAVCGIRTGINYLVRSVTGFDIKAKFGFENGLTLPSNRFFAGLNGATNAAPTDVAPSTKTNVIGMAWEVSDTIVYIIHNDASGTATRLPTSVPKPTTNEADVFELKLYNEPGSTSVTVTVTNIITGVTDSKTITSDMPATTVVSYFEMYLSSGGNDSSALGLCFIDYYCWTK